MHQVVVVFLLVPRTGLRRANVLRDIMFGSWELIAVFSAKLTSAAQSFEETLYNDKRITVQEGELLYLQLN